MSTTTKKSIFDTVLEEVHDFSFSEFIKGSI